MKYFQNYFEELRLAKVQLLFVTNVYTFITIFSSVVKQFDLRWLVIQICCEVQQVAVFVAFKTDRPRVLKLRMNAVGQTSPCGLLNLFTLELLFSVVF